MITDGQTRKNGGVGHAKHRFLTSFDWFVMIVILGYLVVVAQAVMRGGTPSLPYTPSSQLWYDSVLPPTELPEGTSLSPDHARPVSPL